MYDFCMRPGREGATMKKLCLLIVTAALVFALTGCDTGGDDTVVSGPPTVGAQTYLYSGYQSDEYVAYDGDLTVEMVFSDGSRALAGQITAGKLTLLDFPQTVAVFGTWPSDITVEPPETSRATIPGFDVKNEDGNVIGFLQYSHDIWGGNTDIEETLNQLWFEYYTADCTASGTTTFEWNGTVFSTEYNITGKQGWNYFYHHRATKTSTRTASTDISTMPSEMKWSIRPN